MNARRLSTIAASVLQHSRKSRDTTDRMVTSRKLLDGVPIALAAKPW